MKYQRLGGFMWKIWRDDASGKWLATCESLEVTLEEDTQAAISHAILEAITLIVGHTPQAA